jgi:hypothetical protein
MVILYYNCPFTSNLFVIYSLFLKLEMKTLLIFFFLLATNSIFCQEIINQTKKVLFVGNSYTGVNNLPELTRILALSASDTLIYDSNTPGGQTFQGHFADATSTGKIAQGTWDFVVLQEQSQRPSFPDGQVAVEVFPYAKKLDSLVRLANPCTETMFYMTWGRKNGDAANCGFFPPLCTYKGMDSLLYLRYMQMTEQNEAVVSPVGALWHYLRDTHPEIELYSGDESHPSLAGSYAAACSFYTTIFSESPLMITANSTLDPAQALIIREATKLIVFDSLTKWRVGTYEPIANFSYTIGANRTVTFTNTSINADSYYWDFGDDSSVSYDENPIHLFPNGVFNVRLIVQKCGAMDTIYQLITFDDAGINTITNPNITLYPNPMTSNFTIEAEEQMTQICIFDISGKLVFKKQLSYKLATIEIFKLEQGTYFYELDFKSGEKLKGKFVKE